MGARFNRSKKYKTEALVSDEDKLYRLHQLLGKKIKSQGEIFQPSEDFYNLSLIQMADAMLSFIGVGLGKDQLSIGFDPDIKYPGLYFEHEGDHYIFIKQEHQKNAFECAAILAHELMHYVLMGGLNYRLEGRIDNEQLTDMATVYTGLGLVVLNGFAYEGNNWVVTLIGLSFGFLHYKTSSRSFGYYKAEGYAQLLGDYINSNDIDNDYFSGFILPNAVHFLPSDIKSAVRHSETKTELVKSIQSTKRKKTAISLAVVIVGYVVFALITGQNGNSANNTSSTNSSGTLTSQQQQLQNTASNLKSQYNSCENQLSSLQSTLNQTNSQMNTYNNEGDITDYNNLVPQQNQEVSAVQSQQSQCNSLYNQANNAVSSYNQSIGQ